MAAPGVSLVSGSFGRLGMQTGEKKVLNTAVQKQTEKSTQESVAGALLLSTSAVSRQDSWRRYLQTQQVSV